MLKPGIPLRKMIDFFHFMYLAMYNHILGRFPSYIFRKIILKYFYRMKLGKHTNVQLGVRIYAPWKIKIGSNCSIGHNSLLDGRRGIIIQDNVDVAGYVRLLTLGHDLDSVDYRTKGGSITVENDVSIFTGAYILPGLFLRQGSVVAANSVLTKNTEPWVIYAGNPAKKIRERKISHLSYLHNYKRYFH